MTVLKKQFIKGVVLALAHQIDGLTDAITIADYSHHEVHEGMSFTADHNSLSLANGSDIVVAFTTPDTTTHNHMVVLASTSDKGEVEILRSPEITVDTGSDLTIFNRNENSDIISTMLSIETSPAAGIATLDPTIESNEGVRIHHEVMAGGKNNIGGSSRDLTEHILRQNTTYAFRLTSLANSNIVQLTLVWYEHAQTPRKYRHK